MVEKKGTLIIKGLLRNQVLNSNTTVDDRNPALPIVRKKNIYIYIYIYTYHNAHSYRVLKVLQDL